MDYTKQEVLALAKRVGCNPRIHPNGFIQLDLEPVPSWHEGKQPQGHSGAGRRLHVWNPPGFELPRQQTNNEVHDHVFDMHSRVVVGELWQMLYTFDVGAPATHELYKAVYEKKASSRLQPTGRQGRLVLVESFPVHEGGTYNQPAYTLHDSRPADGPVATIMTKMHIYDNGMPTVVCEIGKPPDNDFQRDTAAEPDYLWAAIEAALA